MTSAIVRTRKSTRLPEYDYGQTGAYFLTICTYQRECLFGEIADGEMRLNACGNVVVEEWLRSSGVRVEIELDAFVVMPNHVHAIVIMHNDVGATGRSPLGAARRPGGPAKRSLGAFIAGFKSSVTSRINQLRSTQGARIWQRNYYEHVVRSPAEHDRIRRYIADNPRAWPDDEENPANAFGSR